MKIMQTLVTVNMTLNWKWSSLSSHARFFFWFVFVVWVFSLKNIHNTLQTTSHHPLYSHPLISCLTKCTGKEDKGYLSREGSFIMVQDKITLYNTLVKNTQRMEWLQGKRKERIWSRQACKERWKIPVGPEVSSVCSLPSAQYPTYQMLSVHISYRLQPVLLFHLFCKPKTLSWDMHIPIQHMIHEQKSTLVIPLSLTPPFPPCQVLEINLFPHQLLGWGARRAPQPLLATRDAKLIALTLNLYSML